MEPIAAAVGSVMRNLLRHPANRTRMYKAELYVKAMEAEGRVQAGSYKSNNGVSQGCPPQGLSGGPSRSDSHCRAASSSLLSPGHQPASEPDRNGPETGLEDYMARLAASDPNDAMAAKRLFLEVRTQLVPMVLVLSLVLVTC